MNEFDRVTNLYKYIHSFFREVRIDEYIVNYNPEEIISLGHDGSYVPSIYVGNDFFTLTQEEKEGVLAHELGHLVKIQRQKRFERVRDIIEKKQLEDFIFADESILGGDEIVKFERLKKNYLNGELFADYMAFKKGFGQGMLSFLKRFLAEADFGVQFAVDFVVARIEHLEKRLEEK